MPPETGLRRLQPRPGNGKGPLAARAPPLGTSLPTAWSALSRKARLRTFLPRSIASPPPTRSLPDGGACPPAAASPPSLPGGARRVTSRCPVHCRSSPACRAAQVALLVPRTPVRSVLHEIRPQSLSELVKSQELWNRLPFGEIIPRKEGARVGSHGVTHHPAQPRCPPVGFRGAAFRSQRELLPSPIPRAGNDNGREQDERHSPGADGENGKKGEG